MKRRKKRKKKLTFQERIQFYLKNNESLLRKYGLATSPIVSFPKRKKTPRLSKMAIWVVNKQGGSLDIKIIDTINNETETLKK